MILDTGGIEVVDAPLHGVPDPMDVLAGKSAKAALV